MLKNLNVTTAELQWKKFETWSNTKSNPTWQNFGKMSRYNFKPEFLENTMESLQCFKCKDVPGFAKKQQNRYSCNNNAHQLCEKCKGQKISKGNYLVLISLKNKRKSFLDSAPSFYGRNQTGFLFIFGAISM